MPEEHKRPGEGDIGIVQFPTGYFVGRVSKLRHFREEISAMLRDIEFEDQSGQKFKGKYWLALHERIDMDSNERTILDAKVCESKEIALRFALEWKQSLDRRKAEHAKACKASEATTPLSTNPPARCEALNRFDLEDAAKARLRVLRRQYPRCFEIFDARQSGLQPTKVEIQKAYLEDIATFSGHILTENAPLSGGLVNALFLAQRRFRRGAKAKLWRLVDYEIALNWLPPGGYCFLTEKELARTINDLLDTNFSPGAISQRRAALGLATKRETGPHPR